MIRLLCVGDVVGSPGRRVLAEALPELKASHDLDCTIVNAENIASGSGMTPALYRKVVGYGVDLITMGDHIYRRKEIIPILDQAENIVRPINFPPGAPGKEFALYTTEAGSRVAVVSVIGRLFMNVQADCPFRAMDRVLKLIPSDVKIIIVDMHAEATSEKIAMGWHLDGRASLLFGTHTHVSTGDERILPNGTAYITDLGMTGPYDSVLGRMKDRVLSAFITGVPTPFHVADGDPRLCGVVVEVDPDTGKASSIERVRFEGSVDSEDSQARP